MIPPHSAVETPNTVALKQALDAMQQPNPAPPLIEGFGPPAFSNSKGQLSRLNEPFWASHFVEKETEIIYEPNEDQLYSYDAPTGIFLKRSEDSIRKTLAEQILDASRNWSGFGDLARFRNERDLRGVISHLKGLVEQPNAFIPNGPTVHLQNFILELQADGTFKREPFSPAFRSRTRSPIIYDPTAKAPRFEELLLSHVIDDDRELLQK